MSTSNPTSTPPFALFLGDFNVGKSTLINSLLRQEVVYTSRRESHALPTLLAAAANGEAGFAAWAGEEPATLPHAEFLALRRERDRPMPFRAAGALLSGMPFRSLVLVDTPGASLDEEVAALDVTKLEAALPALLVLVADIEYWNARHTMQFLARHQEQFPGRVVLAANKADHLNPDEIRRITDKAPQRMKAYGIEAPVPFFAVSARLEGARNDREDEYRHRTKRPVRELCDAAFDALRVALYEFEARASAGAQQSIASLFGAMSRGYLDVLSPGENGSALS